MRASRPRHGKRRRGAPTDDAGRSPGLLARVRLQVCLDRRIPPLQVEAPPKPRRLVDVGAVGVGWAKKSGKCFRVGIFLMLSGSPHVRQMGRACGEPDEIELTAIGVKLNGSRRVG